jgi:hypothetical protein
MGVRDMTVNHSAFNNAFALLIAPNVGGFDWGALQNQPDGRTYEILFLSTYCPELIWPWLFFPNKFSVPYSGDVEWRPGDYWPIAGDYTGNGMLVETVGATQTPWLPIKVTTKTNKVAVYGFYGQFINPSRNITDGIAELNAWYFLPISAGGAGVRNLPYTLRLGIGGADPIVQQAVFIPEASYTQNMADSDNWMGGTFQPDSIIEGKIVGLYREIV